MSTDAVAQKRGLRKVLQYFQPSEDPYKGRFLPIPLLTYAPETSLGFGVTGQYLFRFRNTDSTSNLSMVGLTAIYTLNKQVIVHPNWDIHVNNSEYRIAGDVLFQKYPNSFYGIGNDTRQEDKEQFTTKYLLVKNRAVWRAVDHVYLGLQYRLEHMFDPEYKAGGLLDTSNYAGVDGFTQSGLGFAGIIDSRDNTMFPFKGLYFTVSNHFYQTWLGSDADFINLKLDLRAYFNPGKGSHVIAVQGLMQVNSNDPPYMMLSKLGGPEIMRGHFAGRYRDKHIIAAQVEYRFPIYWRFIGTAFAGFGDVADEFNSFQTKNLKYSLGGGLRFTIDAKERINIRFDAGFGLDGSRGFYLGIGEAF